MSNGNGISNSPFDKAWPTPDVGGTGLNGIGGGLDQGGGGNGIIASPFDKAIVPTPGGECTPCADLGQPPPNFIQVDGGSPAGSQSPWDITPGHTATVDKK